MRATAGDRIILAGELVDQPTRAGEVLEARGTDGGPPYVVRWEDGHTSTMFPGPGAVLQGDRRRIRRTAGEAAAKPDLGTLREWSVRVTIFEQGDDTTATVALLADSTEALTATRHEPAQRVGRRASRGSATRSRSRGPCAASPTTCSPRPSRTSRPPPASTTSRSGPGEAAVQSCGRVCQPLGDRARPRPPRRRSRRGPRRAGRSGWWGAPRRSGPSAKSLL